MQKSSSANYFIICFILTQNIRNPILNPFIQIKMNN